MRIGIVTTYYRTIGGISTFVRNVVSHSRTSENTPLVFSPDIKQTRQNEGLISLDPRTRISVIVSLVRELRRHDVRCIQCHGTWYLLLACILYKKIRRLSGTKVRVVTVKHSDLDKPRMIKRLILQTIDNASDGIIFVSNYLKKKYQQEFGFCYAKPLTIINPGCETVIINPNLQAQLAARFNFSSQRPLLSYIGLFEYSGKVRGLILLLEAIARLRSLIPDLLLVIAGRGRLKGDVTEAIERLNLQTAVHIIEDLDSPYELLQLSDLHCHISFQDNFALVVLEALNSGTPVVANAIGELPYLDVGGLIIVASDPESIAVALSRSLEQPPRVDVQAVRERFDWKIATVALNSFTRGSHV